MMSGRVLVAVAALTMLDGCRFFHRSDVESCHKPQEYQRAASVAPLKVPAGMDSPNVQGALVIPAIDNPPPPPGPHDPCLDEPPRYKPPPAARPGRSSPEAAEPPPPPAAAPAPASPVAPGG